MMILKDIPKKPFKSFLFKHKKTWAFGPVQEQLAIPWRETIRVQNSGDRIQNKVFAFGSTGKYKMGRCEIDKR
jgi:hypothetical protein